MTWRNWDGRQSCTPAAIERPTTEAEVARLVRTARDRGQTVRAVGAGHSFTPLALTDGVMLDLAGLDAIEAVDGTRVTVGAGARLHALGPQLAARGLSLANQGDIDAQAVAGALATATHGTGLRFGNLSSQVVSMRLVDGRGEVRELDGGDELRAARVSLGALGVITAVTLECVPLVTLHRHDAPAPLDATLADLDGHVEDNDHFELFVFPHTRTALTRSTRRSHEPPSPPPQWRRRLQEDVVENLALGAVCRTGRRVPRAVPRLNRLITAAMSEGHLVDHAYKVFATQRHVRFTEMEHAVPRTAAREVVRRVLAIAEQGPILFPLELRFSAGDDAFLSTAHARETAYVAVHQYAGMAFEPFFRAVEEVMNEHDGRPHWGKRHFATAATLKPRYPQWDRFAAVRDAFDPDRVFANDHIREVLGA